MVPTYLTTEESVVYQGAQRLTLPANAFIKPIEDVYLPAHIKNSESYKFYNPTTEVYVYCSFGIVLLSKQIIRKV